MGQASYCILANILQRTDPFLQMISNSLKYYEEINAFAHQDVTVCCGDVKCQFGDVTRDCHAMSHHMCRMPGIDSPGLCLSFQYHY